MSEELKPLIHFRGQLKARLTKLNSHFQYVKESPIDDMTVNELKLRVKRIESTLNEFEQVQAKIEALLTTESETIVSDDEQRDLFESTYFRLIAEIQTFIESNSYVASMDTTAPPPSRFQTSQVKLPTLNLPTFSGDSGAWMSFIELFESVIDQNEELTDRQKMQYLKSCLKGDAELALESLDATEINYPIALDVLKSRYENKRVLIKQHLSALFEFPPLKKGNPKNLRQLVDIFCIKIKVLKKNFNVPTEHWDVILIYLLYSKLDFNSQRVWEATSSDSDLTFDDLTSFISKRCQFLESLYCKPDHGANSNYSTEKGNRKSSLPQYAITQIAQCLFCNRSHFISRCNEFQKLSVEDRFRHAKTQQWCINCLKPNHTVSRCSSKTSCKECRKRHHSLLHNPDQASSEEPRINGNNVDNQNTNDNPIPSTSGVTYTSSINTGKNESLYSQVLLSTAVVLVKDNKGTLIRLRALLDSGSTSCFLTEAARSLMKIPIVPTKLSVSGISQVSTQINKSVKIQIQSKYNGFKATLDCLIIPKIASNVPLVTFDSQHLSVPKNVRLADPEYNISRPIDLLIGAELFWTLLCVGQISLGAGRNQPHLQKTQLGWVLGGSLKSRTPSVPRDTCFFSIDDNQKIDTIMRKFWEVEENYQLVKGPLNQEEQQCENRFVETHMRDAQRRFIVKMPFRENISKLGESYETALRRFLSLERKLEKNPIIRKSYSDFIHEYESLGHMELVDRNELKSPMYYLPHHAVLREASITTKLRVVFDGSAKTSSGLSLNDTLMPGPIMQNDLFNILITFRSYQYAFSADITKMYRQIWAHPDDRNYQLIIWRDHLNEPLKTYRLTTVTYGLTSSPYLAIRCLRQLAIENKQQYPLAYNAIMKETYVDDFLTGASTLQEAITKRDQINSVLSKGKFELRKWAANDINLIPLSEQHSKTEFHILCPEDDTKKLRIPRRISTKANINGYEVHGFYDSSQLAYGACIYLKTLYTNKGHSVQLICAKSRIAPLKTITIARLELCGALLLAQLLSRIKEILNFPNCKYFCWTDSKIVLSWIRSFPKTWKIFVANRISEIQSLTDTHIWHHVISIDNPADIISRGALPQQLLDNQLWWHGPVWLHQSSEYPCIEPNVELSEEDNTEKRALALVTDPPCLPFLDRFSSFSHLLRVIAFCQRFYRVIKLKKPIIGPLSSEELNQALIAVVRYAQHEAFHEEIQALLHKRPMKTHSNLLCLNPFLDNNRILRVRGRINHSSISYDAQHQMILPSKHHITNLIIKYEHIKLLHAGQRATLYSLRRKFWPINGTRAVRSVLRSCYSCFRVNPSSQNPLMGNLPTARVTPARPFVNAGVDYGGPISLREGRGRGKRTVKGYIALFICLATKAMHLELVSDLTSSAFISAMHRFISRRGHCSNLYCDNGTNFKGADRELKENVRILMSQNLETALNNSFAQSNITFHFIPANSPHMGGLWEAGIKKVKHTPQTNFRQFNLDV